MPDEITNPPGQEWGMPDIMPLEPPVQEWNIADMEMDIEAIDRLVRGEGQETTVASVLEAQRQRQINEQMRRQEQSRAARLSARMVEAARRTQLPTFGSRRDEVFTLRPGMGFDAVYSGERQSRIPSEKRVYEIRVAHDGRRYVVSAVITNEQDRVAEHWDCEGEDEIQEAIAKMSDLFGRSTRANMDVRLRSNVRGRGHLTREDRMHLRDTPAQDVVAEDSFAIEIMEDEIAADVNDESMVDELARRMDEIMIDQVQF